MKAKFKKDIIKSFNEKYNFENESLIKEVKIEDIEKIVYEIKKYRSTGCGIFYAFGLLSSSSSSLPRATKH